MSSRILFFCEENRRALYSTAIAPFSEVTLWLSDPLEVLLESVEVAPYAILLDTPTSLRSDKAMMHYLHDLRIGVPVLRVGVRSGGMAMALCVEPPRQQELGVALAEILAQDPVWRHPLYRRRRLRVAFQSRVLLDVEGEPQPRQTNTIDVSGGGCFLVTYDPVAPNTSVRLTFVDVDEGTTPCKGRVAWSRGWEAHGLLPGVGIQVDRAAIIPVVRSLLGGIRPNLWPLRI